MTNQTSVDVIEKAISLAESIGTPAIPDKAPTPPPIEHSAVKVTEPDRVQLELHMTRHAMLTERSGLLQAQIELCNRDIAMARNEAREFDAALRAKYALGDRGDVNVKTGVIRRKSSGPVDS